MKRFLILLIALGGIQTALANDAVNLKIKINGSTGNNRYFLCLPDTGCLSIRAGQNGTVYPIFHSVNLSQIYIADADNDLSATPQKVAASCNTNADTSQTVTITGNLVNTGGGVRVNQLQCRVT